ncbi:MAG: MFS transporter [Bacteroidetes bacterium 24-39-8]|jgi:FHS family L-fucose permease-like MFS transporter|nr:MAG: MFS transporter [Bacteroidetes bacterium 24-39-8]OZA63870.1 MAG: MFS transporter [Sphingobacteriia bacterium 39-39-8]HQR93549.1 MFS transporter [Sediminibacterium sp.]HQS55910.1 MFS transporter [Sediminibacterium sp.]
MNQKTNWSQFGTLITVFFFWGFVAASNDILIPVFKKAFTLTQLQSQLVAVAFYVAYTVGSLIYVGVSSAIGGDLLNKIGYKNGIALGLGISAVGTLLFYPAATDGGSFNLMITALFIVALGFSLQQIAANPLAVVIGDPKTGSQRLNMAGGINNFGTTIGPLLVSFAIFGSVSSGNTDASIESVKTPYLILGAAFLLVAIFFKFSSIPNKIDLENVAEKEAESGSKLMHKKSAIQYPQLVMGMIGIFVYVGVEVSTASNLPEYMRQHLGIQTEQIAPYISLYWASLMIGRWTASVGAFGVSASKAKVLNFVMPYLAFAVFLIVNTIAQHDMTQFYIYGLVIIAMIAGDILSKGSPARMLLIFSSMGIVALVIGMLTSGMVSVFAFISVGLFCSTLWPCIFTLAVAGLGKHTNQGSSLLIMMIMGGGVIAALQGWVADDSMLGIQYSYIVGALCFAYLAFYAIRVKSILKSQGIDYDVKATGGGH